jgi:nitroimidazol reductase NimA-like FMN-containing flavoprotein (pyridoxamine 5'-phosphate oxidase superfamily)
MAKHSAKRTARSKSAPSISKREPKASRPFAPGYGIVGAKDGKGLLPWTWVARKMNACRTFWLATVRETSNAERSRPHVMPVWGVWLDEAFYFSTGKKSRKGQNLASNPACTVTNDDGKEAVIIEGLASVAKESSELERVATAYVKKYKMDPRAMGEPIFCVDPHTVFGFVEKTFPQSATRWRLR